MLLHGSARKYNDFRTPVRMMIVKILARLMREEDTVHDWLTMLVGCDAHLWLVEPQAIHR